MTDITELAQREKFEAWARSQKLSLSYGDCGYVFSSTEMAWRAWRASSPELVEALEKARQHIARQEQILLNQDESLSIRRGELESARQERDNWRTSFDNERFRADKLKAHIDEMTEERTASINELSRIIQKEVKAKREAEKRIAELEASHAKLRDAMAAIHNTIRMDGAYTPLAAILNAAKRAHEESASAAGIKWEGE